MKLAGYNISSDKAHLQFCESLIPKRRSVVDIWLSFLKSKGIAK